MQALCQSKTSSNYMNFRVSVAKCQHTAIIVQPPAWKRVIQSLKSFVGPKYSLRLTEPVFPHHIMAHHQNVDREDGLLIYRISTRGQPTRGVPVPSEIDEEEVLICHHENLEL